MSALLKPPRAAALDGLDRRVKPKPSPGRPKRPSNLPVPARQEWDRVVGILDAEGRLSSLDGGLLARHAKLFSYIEQCEKDIDERGLLVEGDRGKVKNPSVQLQRNYITLYHKSCELLGVDPRRRDGVVGGRSDDPENLLD